MRSFMQLVALLFALVAFASAQEEPQSYDATVFVTSTIFKVNTVTLASSPTGSVANETSTISATAYASPVYSVPGNSTGAYPTATGAGTTAPTSTPTAPTEFPGAASGLSVNGALVAALAAAMGLLAL